MTTTDQMWRSRITRHADADPTALKANPQNWRSHPPAQREALVQTLDEVGWVQDVIVNETTGHVIDGHLRIELAIERGEPTVPVVYVELTADEERLVLATLDPLAGMAEPNTAALSALLDDILMPAGALGDLLSSIAATAGLGDSAVDAREDARRTLAERFIVPPFSVLDQRQGYWQDRKSAWLGLGIQSELGRGEGLTYGDSDAMRHTSLNHYRAANTRRAADQRSNLTGAPSTPEWAADGSMEYMAPGTSIFDPVLCEIAYRWFSPPGGRVLDPFAGGSVRGIVAAYLGRDYTGIDLSPPQVETNRAQAAAILTGEAAPTVKISAASARQEFAGCRPDYIRDVCHARCCDAPSSPVGTMITIHPTEEPRIVALGGTVIDGMLQPREGERVCMFRDDAYLCTLHEDEDKPFGCVASPFTLNRNGTLIVRNRYRQLVCFKDGDRIPAYRAFSDSLDLIFGTEEAARITAHLDSGGGDLIVPIAADTRAILLDNDQLKHGGAVAGAAWEPGAVSWVVGDSAELLPRIEAAPFDLLFTCPPYYDLEQYSEDPADLSNADSYEDFREAYRTIISAAVALLAPDSFAVIVISDIRDERGIYRPLVADTVDAFRDAGAALYNEAVLINMAGTLPIRVARAFTSMRKLGRTHQEVLVFVKGDPAIAAERCGPPEIPAGVE